MIDLDRLLKLRLVVARFGEMDGAKWWNTSGMLARSGGLAVARGLPKTHPLARARAVFAVARARCRETYNPLGALTLWDLPPETELAFEDRWGGWIERQEGISELFATLEDRVSGSDLLDLLLRSGCVAAGEVDSVRRLKRAADQRAVPVGAVATLDDSVLTLLAAGFGRGEVGALAVPYARLEGGH